MRWLWIALAVLLALGIVIWRLRLGLYVAFGGGQAAADLTIGPFRIHLEPSKTRKKPGNRESLRGSRKT